MGVSADDIDAEYGGHHPVHMNGNVPFSPEPEITERCQESEYEGDFSDPKDIIYLETHHLCGGVGIFKTRRLSFRQGPLESSSQHLGTEPMKNTRKQDTPNMQQHQDYHGNAVPNMQPQVRVHNIAAINDMIVYPRGRQPTLDSPQSDEQQQIQI